LNIYFVYGSCTYVYSIAHLGKYYTCLNTYDIQQIIGNLSTDNGRSLKPLSRAEQEALNTAIIPATTALVEQFAAGTLADTSQRVYTTPV